MFSTSYFKYNLTIYRLFIYLQGKLLFAPPGSWSTNILWPER